MRVFQGFCQGSVDRAYLVGVVDDEISADFAGERVVAEDLESDGIERVFSVGPVFVVCCHFGFCLGSGVVGWIVAGFWGFVGVV